MTDDTAKAILEYESEDPILLRGLCDPSLIDVPLSDLHAMARLWLMRDEIIAEMNDAGASAHGYRQTFYDLLDKITAIAGESKDGDTKYRG